MKALSQTIHLLVAGPVSIAEVLGKSSWILWGMAKILGGTKRETNKI